MRQVGRSIRENQWAQFGGDAVKIKISVGIGQLRLDRIQRPAG
jgi:hypothetical protein